MSTDTDFEALRDAAAVAKMSALDVGGVDPGRFIKTPEYACSKCRDTGFLLLPDRCARRCDCRDPAYNRDLVRERLRGAGLEEEELRAATGPWDESFAPRPAWARSWLSWRLARPSEPMPPGITDRHPRDPWTLTLYGEPGRGKTKTAAVLARLAVKWGVSHVIWARVPEARKRVQGERGRLEFAEDGLSLTEHRIATAGLAVFDDLGIYDHASERAAAQVHEWLCARHRRHGLTVVTTNATSIDALGDGRLSSRLGAGIYRRMDGPCDYRDRR